MRKIKIKVKHLLAIVIGIFLAVIFIIPNALMAYAGAVSSKDIETSKVFYKRYINLFPFGSRKDEALYNLAKSIIPEDDNNSRYKVYTMGMSSGGTVITGEMIQNATNYYNQILRDYKESKYYAPSYNKLLNLYMMNGRFGEAQSLMVKEQLSENNELRIISSEYRMLYSIIGGKYDEAIKIGAEIISAGQEDPDIYMLLGDASFYDRKLEEALKYYERVKDIMAWKQGKPQARVEFSMAHYERSSVQDKINIIDKFKSGYDGSSSIEGKVTINGNPAPYVYVYLKDEKDGMLNSMGDEDSRINAITDFEGRYFIPSLPEGNYVLGIGVPSSNIISTVFQTPSEGYFNLEEGERKTFDFSFSKPMNLIKPKGTVAPVDGKVEIEWDKVEGAAYYLIYLIEYEDPKKMEGSYGAFSPGDKIKDTKYIIDINKVNMGNFGFMMDGEGIVNPQAYIGNFYPGSITPIYVNAYDREGKLITSSMPIKLNLKDMTAISISSTSLTESDRLVLDRKPVEAITSYEKELEKNPDDVHAMMVLSKLYTLGTRRKYIEGEGEKVEGRNLEQAGELNRKLYEITKDVYYLKAPLSIYFIQTPEDYKKALEDYKKIPETYLETDDYMRMADMYLTIKDYKDALYCFEKVYEAYKDTNYYNLAPVILGVYLEDYDNSMKFLDILDLRLYKVDRDDITRGILRVRDVDKDNGDFAEFKKALDIILSFRADNEYKKHYKDVYQTVDSPALKGLLKQIGNYYYVFEEYN